MSKLFALLVAIDDYPIDRHRLNGCVNDLKAVENYLSKHIVSKSIDFQPLTLTNKEATRENIIKGFEHFNQATKEDICLFFFCGHGSQVPAPEEFWHIEPDQMNESIVCWDSRLPDGRDLMDKELSFLIWQATKDKDQHFVVMMDCCHSGSNTRGVNFKVRMAEPSHTPTKVEDYHGFEFYKKTVEDGQSNYSSPRGNHIHLAAARSIETAKELKVDGQAHGIFTYNLVKTLEQSGGQLSYADLIKNVRIKTANRVSNQSPQVEATHAQDILNPFLNGAVEKKENQFFISFKAELGWVVDAGAADGIAKPSEDSETIFLLANENQPIKVVKVLPDQSVVSGMEAFEKDKVYEAKIIQRSAPKLRVVINKISNRVGVQLLHEAMANGSQFIELVHRNDSPNYIISVVKEAFQLNLPDEDRPVFKRVSGVSPASVNYFLNKIETVAKWVQAIELSNPNSSIRDHEFKIDLFKIDLPGNYEDSAPATSVDWNSPSRFSYEKVNGEWQGPAFRLKITNTGKRLLWVHALYLGKDFSITDQLLAKQDLKPGEEVWLTDVFDGFPYKTIPLQVEDEYLSWEITSINEYIKLFFSTEELAVYRFNQEGLQQEHPDGASRGVGRRKQISGPDWITREIELIIEKPLGEETTGVLPDENIAEPEAEPPPPPKPAAASPADKSKKKKTITTSKIKRVEKRHLPNPSKKGSTTFSGGSSPSVLQRVKDWLSFISKSLSTNPEDYLPPARKIDPNDPKIFEKKETKASESERSIADQLDYIFEEASPSPEVPEAIQNENFGDKVDCSVYAPPEAQKGDDVFIQVWMHIPELKEQVKAMALEMDADAGRRTYQSLKIPLKEGDEITLVLEAKGVELDELSQQIAWNGDYQSAQFIASFPEDYAKSKAFFTLRLFKEDIPIGHIKFFIKIATEVTTSVPEPLGLEAKKYEKAFISYSSKDRNEVLKRVQMLDKLEIDFFQDLISLNPGERWEKKLYENINDSDIFFLFWSTAAKESKWVLQELEYAIKLKQGDDKKPPFIKPVPLEGPPIIPPPDQLGHMHFNDRILYFILKSK